MPSPDPIFKMIADILKKAKQSDGFFFTMTLKNGDTLTHFEQHKDFIIGDFEPSLIEIAKNLNEQYPETCLAILNKTLPAPAIPMTTITRAEG